MRRALLAAAASALMLGACSFSAQEDYQEAFLEQLGEFIDSSDLSESLGLSGEQQEGISQQLRDYVENYQPNEEELAQTKQAVQELLENNEGLTLQEIEDRLSGLLQK